MSSSLNAIFVNNHLASATRNHDNFYLMIKSEQQVIHNKYFSSIEIAS